ncbi:3-deoxy-D-manno-octulosonic acid transferase [Martelella alba]|uniref:3-deoxy-D-manno-octulosonic acid transferase n=1 Tax=Martelella alba TaxID=2590451 RepID=A0A506UG21_9HYPH|nr:lipid IV(A) 3-deoxy-D-manno-octulosonic acid transferase [Martelella alba]TPW30867.1 3-deoxy-D-manno-octulosonic acid transferase [Martelella alba]
MTARISTWLATQGYRFAGVAVYPLLPFIYRRRARRGKEERARKAERFGRTRVARPNGPLVWIHAASVGETLSVAPMMEKIAALGINVLLTTGTVTSAKLAAERFPDQVIHQYVPFDVPRAVSRFLDHWRPDVAINVESEIWPTIMGQLSKRNIPQIFVNGRISDKSYDRWLKRRDFARSLFSQIASVLAQSDLDGERFRELGAMRVSVTGNLKVDRDPPPADEVVLATLRREIGDRLVWAGISTFEGEEKAVSNVHRVLKSRVPGLLTVIVPRHPERCDQLTALFQAKGLNVVRRSEGAAITAETDILLGDTMGEMGLYLRLARIAFVGRSLTATGGQNPLEPAMLGAAIISGPHVQNFQDTYQKLRAAGAARTADTVEQLARNVYQLLSVEKARDEMVVAGYRTVESMRGALAETMKHLDRHLSPLVLEARLSARLSAQGGNAPQAGSDLDTPMHGRMRASR